MKRVEPRVLYFTEGNKVTDEDQRKARLISYNVGFRNASSVGPKDTVEDTDAVAGAAPKSYLAKYPHVEGATQLQEAMRKVKAGTYRFPKFSDVADDEGDGTISEEELARLAGETGEGGDGDDGKPHFDAEAFLSDKSEEFKAGYALAEVDGALPTDAGDDFSAGFNAYAENNTHTDDDAPGTGGGTPNPDVNPATNNTAPPPAPPNGNRRRRAAPGTAKPTTPAAKPATGPTWNT